MFVKRFSLPFRLIHWLMAFILLVMLGFGQRFGTDLPDAERIFSLTGHSSLGVMVVMLLILRVLLRVSGRARRPDHGLRGVQALLSQLVQGGLYLLMIYLPVTGALTARAHKLPVQPFGLSSISTPDPAQFEMMRFWHELGTKAFIVLLILHIGAAFLHRYLWRDGVMNSMSLLKQK